MKCFLFRKYIKNITFGGSRALVNVEVLKVLKYYKNVTILIRRICVNNLPLIFENKMFKNPNFSFQGPSENIPTLVFLLVLEISLNKYP